MTPPDVADLRISAAQHAQVAYDESVIQLEDVLAFERGHVTNLRLDPDKVLDVLLVLPVRLD